MQNRQPTPVMARLNDTSSSRATAEIIFQNYDNRVYGRRQRYAMPSALTSVDGVDKMRALEQYTMQDLIQLHRLLNALPEDQTNLPAELVARISGLTASNYQQTEFVYADIKALESYLAAQNVVEMTDEEIQATQADPLPNPRTLDALLVLNKNAASSQAHTGSIKRLILSLASHFHGHEEEQFSQQAAAAVTDKIATNLSRMLFLDKEAIRALCHVYGVDEVKLTQRLGSTGTAVTLAEIRAAKTRDPEANTLAVAIEALFEAAYFGSGRAFQSLIEAHEAGIYEFTDEELCLLVDAQMAWYRISLATKTPRDSNRVHYEAYSFADDFSAAQCLPDLIAYPKTWKAVHANTSLFQNLLSNVYHQKGDKAVALLVANEQFDVEVKLSSDDVRQLVKTLITLYVAAQQSGSSVEGDIQQILPKFFPEARYARLWEALRGQPAESYALLRDFWLQLGRQFFDADIVTELTAKGPRSDEERELAVAAEVAEDAKVASPALALKAEQEPEKFIAYIQDDVVNELSRARLEFAALRAELLKAMGGLRHYALAEKLMPTDATALDDAVQEELDDVKARKQRKKEKFDEQELVQIVREDYLLENGSVYDMRPIIEERKLTNQAADKKATESLMDLVADKHVGLQKQEAQVEEDTQRATTRDGYQRLREPKDSLYGVHAMGVATSTGTLTTFRNDTATVIESIRSEAVKDEKAYQKLKNSSTRRKSILESSASFDKDMVEKRQLLVDGFDAKVSSESAESVYEARKAKRERKIAHLELCLQKIITLSEDAYQIYKNKDSKSAAKTMNDATKIAALNELVAKADEARLLIVEGEFVDDVRYMEPHLKSVRDFIILQKQEASAGETRDDVLRRAKDLLSFAEKLLNNPSMDRAARLERLAALQSIGQGIMKEIVGDPEQDIPANDVLSYMQPFVEKINGFIVAQNNEINAQAKREARLQQLETREQALVKALAEMNPVTEFIRFAFLAYVQDLVKYGHPTYDWQDLIARSLEEDKQAYEYGAFAYKNVNRGAKAREAMPLLIAANAPGYIKLFAIYMVSQSAEDFWAKVQDMLFDDNGLVTSEDSTALLDLLLGKSGYPVTTDKKKSEHTLRQNLLTKYTVTDHHDPLQAMLNSNVMLALVLSVSRIFPSDNNKAAKEVLAEADIICGRIGKLVNRLDAEGNASHLSDYLKIAMMMLGDNEAFASLLFNDTSNPIVNVCQEKELEFDLPEEVKFAINGLRDDSAINKSTLRYRSLVLGYLSGYLTGNSVFEFLLTRFQKHINTQDALYKSDAQSAAQAKTRRTSEVGTRRSSVTSRDSLEESPAVATRRSSVSSVASPVSSVNNISPKQESPQPTVMFTPRVATPPVVEAAAAAAVSYVNVLSAAQPAAALAQNDNADDAVLAAAAATMTDVPPVVTQSVVESEASASSATVSLLQVAHVDVQSDVMQPVIIPASVAIDEQPAVALDQVDPEVALRAKLKKMGFPDEAIEHKLAKDKAAASSQGLSTAIHAKAEPLVVRKVASAAPVAAVSDEKNCVAQPTVTLESKLGLPPEVVARRASTSANPLAAIAGGAFKLKSKDQQKPIRAGKKSGGGGLFDALAAQMEQRSLSMNPDAAKAKAKAKAEESSDSDSGFSSDDDKASAKKRTAAQQSSPAKAAAAAAIPQAVVSSAAPAAPVVVAQKASFQSPAAKQSASLGEEVPVVAVTQSSEPLTGLAAIKAQLGTAKGGASFVVNKASTQSASGKPAAKKWAVVNTSGEDQSAPTPLVANTPPAHVGRVDLKADQRSAAEIARDELANFKRETVSTGGLSAMFAQRADADPEAAARKAKALEMRMKSAAATETSAPAPGK